MISFVQELNYCRDVVLSVSDEMAMRTVIDELLRSTAHNDLVVKRPAVCILQVRERFAFCFVVENILQISCNDQMLNKISRALYV